MDTILSTNHSNIDRCISSTRLSLGVAHAQLRTQNLFSSPSIVTQGRRQKTSSFEQKSRLRAEIAPIADLPAPNAYLHALTQVS